MQHLIRRASTAADWDDALALLHDHLEWIRARTAFDLLVEQPAFAHELDHIAEHYATEGAVLFLAEWRAMAVGTVALHDCGDGSAELKRMYVRPVARGRGIADGLVRAAAAAATELGCDRIWLETLRGPMDPAIAVYRRNGFVESAERAPTLGIPGVVVMERPVDAARCCA